MQMCIRPSGLRCRGKDGETTVAPILEVSRRNPSGNDSVRSTGAQSVFPQHSWGYHSWQAAAEDITVAAKSANIMQLRYIHPLREPLLQRPQPEPATSNFTEGFLSQLPDQEESATSPPPSPRLHMCDEVIQHVKNDPEIHIRGTGHARAPSRPLA